jgi:DNA invertase Pin-like site-specific DNA recombinase
MSGTRADRPQLAAALEFAREGDVLIVTRLDRLARFYSPASDYRGRLAGT